MGRSAPSASAPNDWLIGWRVPVQAPCPRRDPTHPAAAVIPVPHCASLRHRQCNTCGSRRSAYGGCGGAPGSLHWYRARPSSSTRSCRYASPMLNRRLPRNAGIPPGTHDDSTHLVLHFIPSAPRCFRCAQGYRCCEPWTHSSLCRHSALPCLRFTAHRHRQSTTSSLEQVQGTMLSHRSQRY